MQQKTTDFRNWKRWRPPRQWRKQTKKWWWECKCLWHKATSLLSACPHWAFFFFSPQFVVKGVPPEPMAFNCCHAGQAKLSSVPGWGEKTATLLYRKPSPISSDQTGWWQRASPSTGDCPRELAEAEPLVSSWGRPAQPGLCGALPGWRAYRC